MNIDIIIYILFLIPFVGIVLTQEKSLHDKKLFLKLFLFSIILVVIGIIFLYDKTQKAQKISYFGSQMTFIFLFLYKFVSLIYYPIFLREPEFSKNPKYKIDIIPTLIIFTGTISLPFIVDTYFTQQIFK